VKAVLHTQYGSPDLLELREMGNPLVERRLAAGERPENIWGRADRALRGDAWNP
jgi:hypothetical protein